MNLVFNDIWKCLQEDWHIGPRFIAVAYLSCDTDLTFSPNDVLVVNASDGAIQSGQTDAKALRRASEAGAKVFSNDDLHAKLYVLGPKVYIGSANASLNARNGLIESMAWSADPYVVGSAMNFIGGLQCSSGAVDEPFLKRIEALPVSARKWAGRQRKAPLPIIEPQCWLVCLAEDAGYPGDHEAADKLNEELGEQWQQEVDWFWWPSDGSKFYKEARKGDSFIEIVSKKSTSSAGRARVTPPQIILEAIPDEKRKQFHYIWSGDANDHDLSWREFQNLVAQADWSVDLTSHSQRLIPQQIARQLVKLWPR